jgi:hypothetical protein
MSCFQLCTKVEAAFVLKKLWLLDLLIELLTFEGKSHSQKPNQTGPMSHSSQTHGPHTRKGTTLMVQT